MNVRNNLFVLALAVMGLCLTASVARADILTLNVTGAVVPAKGAASCTPTCTLSGNIVLNNTAGSIVSANVDVTGDSPDQGIFTLLYGTGFGGGGGVVGANASISLVDSTNTNLLKFYIFAPTDSSLVGYTGGPAVKILLSQDSALAGNDWTGTGALTGPVTATPEPASLLLLGTGLVGLFGAGRRKLSR